jgi:hypothetical protein
MEHRMRQAIPKLRLAFNACAFFVQIVVPKDSFFACTMSPVFAFFAFRPPFFSFEWGRALARFKGVNKWYVA